MNGRVGQGGESSTMWRHTGQLFRNPYSWIHYISKVGKEQGACMTCNLAGKRRGGMSRPVKCVSVYTTLSQSAASVWNFPNTHAQETGGHNSWEFLLYFDSCLDNYFYRV